MSFLDRGGTIIFTFIPVLFHATLFQNVLAELQSNEKVTLDDNLVPFQDCLLLTGIGSICSSTKTACCSRYDHSYLSKAQCITHGSDSSSMHASYNYSLQIMPGTGDTQPLPDEVYHEPVGSFFKRLAGSVTMVPGLKSVHITITDGYAPGRAIMPSGVQLVAEIHHQHQQHCANLHGRSQGSDPGGDDDKWQAAVHSQLANAMCLLLAPLSLGCDNGNVGWTALGLFEGIPQPGLQFGFIKRKGGAGKRLLPSMQWLSVPLSKLLGLALGSFSPGNGSNSGDRRIGLWHAASSASLTNLSAHWPSLLEPRREDARAIDSWLAERGIALNLPRLSWQVLQRSVKVEPVQENANALILTFTEHAISSKVHKSATCQGLLNGRSQGSEASLESGPHSDMPTSRPRNVLNGALVDNEKAATDPAANGDVALEAGTTTERAGDTWTSGAEPGGRDSALVDLDGAGCRALDGQEASLEAGLSSGASSRPTHCRGNREGENGEALNGELPEGSKGSGGFEGSGTRGFCSRADESPWEVRAIRRKLIGRGQHRELHTWLRLVRPCRPQGCIPSENMDIGGTGKAGATAVTVGLVERLPAEIFIDPFEIDRLQRPMEVLVHGKVDLEVPVPLAQQTMASIQVAASPRLLGPTGPGQRGQAMEVEVEVEIGLPLHSRYPAPVSPVQDRDWSCAQTHALAELSVPQVFVRGPEMLLSQTDTCQPESARKDPAGTTDWHPAVWGMEAQVEGYTLQWAIPAGCLAHSRIVSWVTAGAAIGGTVFFIYAIYGGRSHRAAFDQ